MLNYAIYLGYIFYILTSTFHDTKMYIFWNGVILISFVNAEYYIYNVARTVGILLST